MNKKIAIIGGGLFGISTYIILKQEGYDCTLFEKNKNLLLGASTNNLNRVHFGYHYPRDNLTAKQSIRGYLSFKRLYKKAIIKNFENYYLIADKSKVNFSNYIKFCKKNKLSFKKIKKDSIKFNLNQIEGGIKVQEPIYDWKLIKQRTKLMLKKIKNNDIHLNEQVLQIKKKNIFQLTTNKKTYFFDIIIDATYEQSNSLIKSFKKVKKKKYQLVVVFEFIFKNIDKMGIALMDGNFFSFLPKGNQKKHLLYHVKHSIIKQKICKEYPSTWKNVEKYNSQINNQKKLILKDFKKFLPSLDINLTKSKFVNPRVLPINVEKTDRRVSKINEITKNYFQIFSAKVDHSVDIAYSILQKLKKIK